MTRTLLRNTQGAVMAEGIIVLPLFIIVLAALFHFHHMFAAKLERSVEARSCAWIYSIHGCNEENMPEHCNLSDVGNVPSIMHSVDAKGETTTNSQKIQEYRQEIKDADDGSKGWKDGLSSANDLLLTLLGLDQGITARPTRTVRRPSLFGGEEVFVSGDYSIMCNEKVRTPGDIVKGAYHHLANKIGF